LALQAREVDMRASPYDLHAYQVIRVDVIVGVGVRDNHQIRGKIRVSIIVKSKPNLMLCSNTNPNHNPNHNPNLNLNPNPKSNLKHNAIQNPSGIAGDGLGGDFNPDPIFIETLEGRKEYVKHQEILYLKSQPVRLRLLNCYREVLKFYP
jgi:hypothetical protein